MSLSSSRLILALAGLVVAVPILAAPVPSNKSTQPILDRYLPDDTDFVAVVNVKQIISAPMFTKNFKKRVDEALASEVVAPFLKGTGVDLYKDVDQVVMILGRCCYTEKGSTREDGPVFLAKGRFEPATLHKKMEQLGKDMPKMVTAHGAGKEKFYQVALGGAPFYVAVLDRSWLMLGIRKEHITSALAKASGTKQTKFTHKALPAAALKSLKSDSAVSGVGLENMVAGTSYHFEDNGNGKVKGKGVMVRKHSTLGDSGFKMVTGHITIKEDLRGKVEFPAKNKDELDKVAAPLIQGLTMAKKEIREEVGRMPKLGPIARVVEGIKVEKTKQALVFEGMVNVEAIQAYIELITELK